MANQTERIPAPKSVVDRSVVTILSDPDDTPSSRDGITSDVERSHRLYGTSLLSAACHLLGLNASTYATACTIFHRFYHRVSLTKDCVWSVAMASLLLATKMEDGAQQRNVRTLVLTFDHLYRKRRGCLVRTTDSDHAVENQGPVLPMPKLGPVWKEYYEKMLEMENRILRELGFTLYWIPDSHPHKFLWEFLRLLFQLEERQPLDMVTGDNGPNNDSNNTKDNNNKGDKYHHALAQRAWNYCNDSCRLDLCTRFESEVIACAAIYLAAMDLNITLPIQPKPWWELFLGKDMNSKDSNSQSCGQNISTVANAILGLVEYERLDPSHKKFLPSLVVGGSFNDPDSFLWESRGKS